MRNKLNRDEIHWTLTTNLEGWKRGADIIKIQELNDQLSEDDISTICDPSFYDAIHDEELELVDILDKHFLNTDLHVYGRASFILMHDIYNI